ncbi:MAG: TerB family tellurite resistance protein [Pseudomonadota bacterium]
MIDKIKQFFEERLHTSENADSETRVQEIQYASAALLIELARADFQQDDLEKAVIMAMLKDTFDLDDKILAEVVALAETATAEAHDVYQFTQLVNDHYNYEDKIRLVENLWEVAYADGRLDRYEEQFIRKVSGLLHLAHADFIRAKVDVLKKIESMG